VTGGGVFEVVSANNSNPAGAWRFIIGRWDIAGNKLAIEVYSDAGNGTLTPVSVVETTSLGLVAQSTAFVNMQLAMHPGSDAADVYYFDHFLVSDVYDAPLQNNAFITDYLDYTESTTASYAIRVAADAAAAGVTGVSGAVFEVPSGSDITGTKIGEFTARSFEATLESGQAVMYVPLAAFGGDGLLLTDTPVVFARNANFHTDVTPCTVVEV